MNTSNWIARLGAALSLLGASMGVAHAAPSAPALTEVEVNRTFVWVLIHGDVSFLVPSSTASAAGTAYVTWAAVSGATSYEYRLLINGQWSAWITAGSNTYANLSGLNASSSAVNFEVRACDASGCSTTASSTVISTAWVNVGLCDPGTGKQLQVCVVGVYCPLQSTRLVDGGCLQDADCP